MAQHFEREDEDLHEAVCMNCFKRFMAAEPILPGRPEEDLGIGLCSFKCVGLWCFMESFVRDTHRAEARRIYAAEVAH